MIFDTLLYAYSMIKALKSENGKLEAIFSHLALPYLLHHGLVSPQQFSKVVPVFVFDCLKKKPLWNWTFPYSLLDLDSSNRAILNMGTFFQYAVILSIARLRKYAMENKKKRISAIICSSLPSMNIFLPKYIPLNVISIVIHNKMRWCPFKIITKFTSLKLT